MSRSTSEAFFDVIEWAAVQLWSTGKVGLLGISYYAGSQWRVAARRPKGLKAIIPWEGMSDYYRDRCRHGGILANSFISIWWNRQVITNQYGRPGRKSSNWGPDTIEGDLSTAELEHNRRDQTQDNARNYFRDQEYYASKEYALEDIEVPLLSVANFGGLHVHLRGNVEGFTHAGSELKYLRFITGRHDLPLYYDEEVEVQKSFLDAFLKDDDRVGWSVKDAVPKVDVVLRKGDVPVNNAEAERLNFKRRSESEWPIKRTQYTKYYLTPQQGLQTTKPVVEYCSMISYAALGSEENPQLALFATDPFKEEVEITGHITAHLNVSLQADPTGPVPSDIDLFVTLRHISPEGKEICYTGSGGDATPATKGWLRVSLRKVNDKHVRHRPWLPHRDYFSMDVLPVVLGEVYGVDVEVLPTNVVVERGGSLAFEVSSGDTSGTGIFKHNHPEDRFVVPIRKTFRYLQHIKTGLIVGRPASKFQGTNSIRFGPHWENYVTLPIIPSEK